MLKKLVFICLRSEKAFIFKIIMLNVLFIINSIIQLIYVSSIYPVVNSLTGGPNLFEGNLSFIKNILININIDINDPIILAILTFVAVSIVANLSLILTNYINFSFSNNLLTSFRVYLFSNYCNRSYLDIISNNLSFYNTNLLQQIDRVVMNTLGSINNISQQIFLAMFLILPLIFFDPYSTLIIFLFLSIIFSITFFILRNFYKISGKKTSIFLHNRTNSINELIRSFREIKIFNLFENVKKKFLTSEKNINNISKITSFITHSTKPFMEIFLVLISSLVLISLIQTEKIDIDFIAKISVFLFAFYKLVPAFNSTYSSLNTLMFDRDAINRIYQEVVEFNYDHFQKNEIKQEQFSSVETISLNNIYLKYKSSTQISLNNVSAEFEKNKIYLIKGESGAGKSSFLNILMGLIDKNEGIIQINKKKTNIYENTNWFNKISYVTQKINLLNKNIKINISLEEDENKINIKKIYDTLKLVNLYDEFVDRMDENFIEDSANISGGQLQRIGISRALYRESEIIILDEPTSNLDQGNELKIFNLLNSIKKDKIIIIVSHKDLDPKFYDIIYNMKEGKIV
jgi:ATP-binding cassette, subfamily B, bacterial PglK